MYGGVPIVDHVQNPVIGDGNGENLVIPRSSTKACIDFICDDLELAASYLPARWQNEGQDYGRITAGAALALKGRTLLLYASPLFNRADDASRWKDAYDANFAAITKLNEGNFGLAYEGNGGEDNAKNWARMFATYTGGSEAVFVTLYNNVSPIASQNINRYNLWEQGIRPGNINGGGGKTPTAEIIDIFPMIDGKKPMESGVHYDPKKFFLNRDPRFYRTFAFPGVEWKFNSGNVDFQEQRCLVYAQPVIPVVRTMNFGIIVGILRLMSVIIRVEAVLQPICWALRIEESMFVNVRMILIWALVFMCLLITAVVISRDSDDRQLLTWRYGMRKYC